MTDQPPHADPNATPPAAMDPASEEDLWEGRASWKSVVPLASLWLLVTLVVTIALGVLTNRTAVLTALAVLMVVLLLLLFRCAWRIWSASYKISTQRIFIRRGVLTQTVDQTELLRVDDVKTRQTLIERMLGIGCVEVVSSDRTDSRLLLEDILDPNTVAEHIRRNTRNLQRRTLFMEQL